MCDVSLACWWFDAGGSRLEVFCALALLLSCSLTLLLSGSLALLLSGSLALLLSCSLALLLSCSRALLLACSRALLLSCSLVLVLSCSLVLLLSFSFALLLRGSYVRFGWQTRGIHRSMCDLLGGRKGSAGRCAICSAGARDPQVDVRFARSMCVFQASVSCVAAPRSSLISDLLGRRKGSVAGVFQPLTHDRTMGASKTGVNRGGGRSLVAVLGALGGGLQGGGAKQLSNQFRLVSDQ